MDGGLIRDAFVFDHGGVDALVEGYYLLHPSGQRIAVPIRIWFGAPRDPLDPGILLDRSPRWQIEINGILFGDAEYPPTIAGRPIEDVGEFWPRCSAAVIDEAEYRYRVDRAEYAEQYDDADPFVRTGGKVNPMTASLP